MLDKLGFLQAIEEGIRGINKKLDDNNQQALEIHQATLDSRAKNQEQLLQPLEKVQPRGGSSPMVLVEDTTKTLGGQGPKELNNKAEEKMEKQAVEMSQPLHKTEEISKEQSKKAPIKSLEDRPNFASLVTQETLGKQKDTQPKANEPKKCFFGSGDTYGEEDDTYGI